MPALCLKRCLLSFMMLMQMVCFSPSPTLFMKDFVPSQPTFTHLGSGGVDKAELGVIMNKFYREQKMARPPARVQQEVDQAMVEFDADGNGTLEVPVTHIQYSRPYDEPMMMPTHHCGNYCDTGSFFWLNV